MKIFSLLIVLTVSLCVSKVFAQKDLLTIDLQKEKAAAKELLDSGITFKTESDGDGRTSEGGVWSAANYECSDGVYISSSGGDYKTPENAQKKYEETLKSAVRQFEQNDIFSKKDGSKIGQKALVILEDAEKNYIFVRVTWYKTFMIETTSTTLKHLLAYELQSTKQH